MPTMPKRTEELQRDRSRKGARDPITYGQMLPVNEEDFTPDPDWHPTAIMLWNAALSSGQRDYYQNSDYAILYHACEELTRYKTMSRPSSQLLMAIMQTLGDLLVTEGDRRRVRLELQLPKGDEQDNTSLGKGLYADMFSSDPVSIIN